MFEKSKWIGFEAADTSHKEKEYKPSAYIAKTFTLKAMPTKAVLNICGYGEGAYYLNGESIPDSFRPAIPSLISKTVIYNSYDVTKMLKKGNNRIGIILSNYRCFEYCLELTQPMRKEVILQLDITYADNTYETIVSDTSFKAFESPVLFTADTFGEIYDARKEIVDWCNPDFDDAKWYNVSEAPVPTGNFRKTDCPQMIKYDENKGVEILPGLFDFKVTTSGYVRMKITGKYGQRIKLNYSERLTPDEKHIDSSTFQKDKKPYPDMYNSSVYILNGEKNKVFEALFSIHGFRYVEVIGEYEDIELTAVTAHTNIVNDSLFVCDNKILNGIHRNCIRSIKTCCQGFWVDNPKRDAAWSGDEMLSAEAIAINFNSYSALYENMMMCKDLQNSNGIIPNMLYGGEWAYNGFIGPEWTDGVLFHVPYYAYKYTGNRKIVDDMWDCMNLAIDNFKNYGDGGYLLNKKGTGDWAPTKEGCSLEIVMTVYYRISALMMAELADATGRNSSEYYELAEKIKNDFRKKYVKNGVYCANHITEYITAAYVGFLEAEEKEKAVEKIINMLRDDNMSITFGTHGNRMIYDLLSECGYQQIIYDILTNDKELGFAQQVKDGLTTLPEKNLYASEPIMSLNHHFKSHVDTWFFKWVAGIKINGFGYDNIVIEPSFIDGINEIKARVHGITVCYNKETVKIQSPYKFTYKNGNKVLPCDAGSFEFKR